MSGGNQLSVSSGGILSIANIKSIAFSGHVNQDRGQTVGKTVNERTVKKIERRS
jgi:hypothetical protein